MKAIALKKLNLQNFQGGSFILDADCQDISVWGDNATGKTRLVSAFTWLLFGKDALGRTDFAIKNLDATGEAEHGLDHSVEAILDIDGEPITLKKIYREKWTKKKGSPQAIFTGHTIDHFIDGVPVQEKIFKEKITEITGDEETFRLLSSPTAFPNLHWQKQRTILFDIAGNLTDAEVVASNPKLITFPAILGKKTVEELKKVIQAKKMEINKELEKLPIRISEVQLGLSDIVGLNKANIKTNISNIEFHLNNAKLRQQGLATAGQIAKIGNELTLLNLKIKELEGSYRDEKLKKANLFSLQIGEIDNKIKQLERNSTDIIEQIKSKNNHVNQIDRQIQNLRVKWSLIDTKVFQDTTEEVCPACKQNLPFHRVQEARNNALAQFNASKAQRLTEITDNGNRLQSELDTIKANLESLEKEQIEAINESLGQKGLLLQLQRDYEYLKNEAVNYKNIPEYINLFFQKDTFEQKLRIEKEGHQGDISELEKEILLLQNQLNEKKELFDRFARWEEGQKRLEELKAQEKLLAKEYENLERDLYLTDLFITTKVSMLTGKINQQFEFVKFKLFNVLINGAVEETCELTVNGVPFNAGLNNSARIQGGLDIIRTLQRHYGLSAVVWIDNRESVVEIPKMFCQVISLLVSEKDKNLRIEREL